MKTKKVNFRKDQENAAISVIPVRINGMLNNRLTSIIFVLLLIPLLSIFAGCKKDSTVTDATVLTPTGNDQYTITQAISDEAQRNTIAFDGLAFLTGNL